MHGPPGGDTPLQNGAPSRPGQQLQALNVNGTARPGLSTLTPITERSVMTRDNTIDGHSIAAFDLSSPTNTVPEDIPRTIANMLSGGGSGDSGMPSQPPATRTSLPAAIASSSSQDLSSQNATRGMAASPGPVLDITHQRSTSPTSLSMSERPPATVPAVQDSQLTGRKSIDQNPSPPYEEQKNAPPREEHGARSLSPNSFMNSAWAAAASAPLTATANQNQRSPLSNQGDVESSPSVYSPSVYSSSVNSPSVYPPLRIENQLQAITSTISGQVSSQAVPPNYDGGPVNSQSPVNYAAPVANTLVNTIPRPPTGQVTSSHTLDSSPSLGQVGSPPAQLSALPTLRAIDVSGSKPGAPSARTDEEDPYHIGRYPDSSTQGHSLSAIAKPDSPLIHAYTPQDQERFRGGFGRGTNEPQQSPLSMHSYPAGAELRAADLVEPQPQAHSSSHTVLASSFTVRFLPFP